MAIKALLMDLYGTMVRENDGLIRDIARRVCETSPQVISPGDVAHYWWETMNGHFRSHNGDDFKPMAELEELALLELAGRFESRFNVQDALEEIALSWQRPEVYSDVRQLMFRLPLPICVVANGDREPIVAAVKYAQLEVQAIVTSEELISHVSSLARPGIEVMTARDAKGLEFDSVVIADPNSIARVPQDLYVALTRSTRRLVLVHHGQLPEGLAAI